jgi:hypothetical protein
MFYLVPLIAVLIIGVRFAIGPRREAVAKFTSVRESLRTAVDQSRTQELAPALATVTETEHVAIVGSEIPTTRRRRISKRPPSRRTRSGAGLPVVRISSVGPFRVPDREAA